MNLADRVASRFVQAKRKKSVVSEDRLVTAEEMMDYCPACAEEIREGSMQMTWGELNEMLEDSK